MIYILDGHSGGEARIEVVESHTVNYARGIRKSTMSRHTLTGEVIVADTGDVTNNANALTAAVETFENALSNNYRDFGLYLPDGSTLTHMKLFDNGSVGGTRVLSLAYPEGAGAEYVLQRKFTAVIEAEYEDPNFAATGGLVAYQETLQFPRNGWPTIVWQELVSGPPQAQTVTEQTTHVATQKGSATGYRSYPIPNAPLWPTYRTHHGRPQYDSPERYGNDYINWPISWEYRFERDYPFVATPFRR